MILLKWMRLRKSRIESLPNLFVKAEKPAPKSEPVKEKAPVKEAKEPKPLKSQKKNSRASRRRNLLRSVL